MEDVNKEALDQLKEEAKSWLTEETCEAEVTRAVDNPINPNFAVDQQGFIIRRTAQVVWRHWSVNLTAVVLRANPKCGRVRELVGVSARKRNTLLYENAHNGTEYDDTKRQD